MNAATSTAEQLIGLIQSKAPEFLDLLTARSDTEFDSALESLIGKAIINMEQNSSNFAQLGEVALTAVLVGNLSIPGITVTQEEHSNGHVDISVSANYSIPPRKRLGEAKLYDGYQYHVKGLEQLVGRYTTGREGRGLIFAYHRGKNIEGAIKILRSEMDTNRPQGQKGDTVNGLLKWSFRSLHAHSSGTEIEVAHYGCNMHNPVGTAPTTPAEQSKQKETSDEN